MPQSPTNRESLVRDRAYQIWEAEGCPDYCADRHWAKAEAEVGQGAGEPALQSTGAAAPKPRGRGKRQAVPGA